LHPATIGTAKLFSQASAGLEEYVAKQVAQTKLAKV
jgi:hypothetical protein